MPYVTPCERFAFVVRLIVATPVAMFMLFAELKPCSGASSYFEHLRSFDSVPDGAYPRGRLIQSPDGTLYGTAILGGRFQQGTLFRMNANGSGFQVLHHFDGTNGSGPSAEVLIGSDDCLYGVTSAGGLNPEAGTVFRIAKSGTSFQVLHRFVYSIEIGGPYAPLMEGSDGFLYGTYSEDGPAHNGTIWHSI